MLDCYDNSCLSKKYAKYSLNVFCHRGTGLGCKYYNLTSKDFKLSSKMESHIDPSIHLFKVSGGIITREEKSKTFSETGYFNGRNMIEWKLNSKENKMATWIRQGI